MELIFVLGIVSIPYIILFFIIFWIIKTKLIKNKVIKILIIILILLSSYIILHNIKGENFSDLYTKMNEINDSQCLIGLSKEDVVELLGEPKYKINDDINVYAYDAGSKKQGLFFFDIVIYSDYFYSAELRISFDENDKVKSTAIEYVD